MPVYTYHCENCGHEFDKQQSFNEETLRVCPHCRKHSLHKVYKPTGVVFKGSGFYVTDKRSSGASSPNGGSKATTSQSDAKSQSETSKASKSE